MKNFRQVCALGLSLTLILARATAADGAAGAQPIASFPRTFSDGAGRMVNIAAAPQRIVSLSPAATDILEISFTIHTEVVGVTLFCRIPAEDESRVARVGGVVDPDYERILALKPDLVIAPFLADKTLQEKLISLGLTVVVLHGESLQGILDDIRLLGRATGHDGAGEAAAKHIDDIRTLVASRWQSVPENQRPRVLLRMGDSSPAPGSYVDDLITAAGGRNALPRGPRAWVEVSPESALQLAPDLVIDIRSSNQTAPGAAPEKSVSPRSVAITAGDEFYHPGPGVGQALWDLARVLYPARFPEAAPPAATAIVHK
jgi:iron complex transport system substrate-binding protein